MWGREAVQPTVTPANLSTNIPRAFNILPALTPGPSHCSQHRERQLFHAHHLHKQSFLPKGVKSPHMCQFTDPKEIVLLLGKYFEIKKKKYQKKKQALKKPLGKVISLK